MNKKRALAFGLAMILLAAVSGCGENKTVPPAEPTAQESTEPVSGETEPPVTAQWAEEATDSGSDCETFEADTSEQRVGVLFSTDSAVSDFKLLALTLEDVDESGNASFAVEELYTLNSLTPTRPLLIQMTFFGDIPNYGIAYVDGNGVERRYTVQVSGKDGSLVLEAF